MKKSLPSIQSAKLQNAKEEKAQKLRQLKRIFALALALTIFFAAAMAVTAYAGDVTINVTPQGEPGGVGAIEVIFILAFLSLLPSIILMMTCYTRIIIVLGFTRSALGTAQSPPNIVLTGLSFFLTLFIMMPVINQMNAEAYQPFKEGEMTTTEALSAAAVPLKRFMLLQTTSNSLNMFLDIADVEVPQVKDPTNPVELLDLSLLVITPAFITSEISRAFMMGFFIYLPFLVIDLVVSSILMSMGMMMMPPAMISLPFKILMFVMVDGWNLLMGTLANSFVIMGPT